MKAYLTRRYMFSASHRLHSPGMSTEENKAVYGKCNNPHGHGHNYAVEVTVAGQVDPATGMVCNLVDLDSFVQKKILQRFDHENLNTLAEFQRTDILHRDFHHAAVDQVRVEETMLNSFAYAGDREIRR
jgi:6-pyruvoyltetrahydropterin/6-carboxytetrahydropterin synthase